MKSDDEDAWLGSADCLPRLLEEVPERGVVVDLGTGTGRILPELSRRAERVNGYYAIKSVPTQGTTVKFSTPLTQEKYRENQ